MWSDFRDPQPGEHQALVEVWAAAISHVVKGRASGKHYSFDGRLPLSRYRRHRRYLPRRRARLFRLPVAPWGSTGATGSVALNSTFRLLPDAPDDITAAAMANPGMSAWAALVKRAGMKAGKQY